MDTNETQMSGDNKTDIEDINSQPAETMQIEETTEDVTSEVIETVSGEKVFPTSEEVKSTPIKDAIEILEVELLVPRREEPGGDEIVSDESVDNKNSEVEINRSSDNNTQQYASENASDDIDIERRKEVSENIKFESNLIDKVGENVEKDNSENKETKKEVNVMTTASSLSLLAQYCSDNEEKTDEDSVVEIPISFTQDYRNQVVEINSDSDSDVECLNELRKTIENRIDITDDEDEDGGGGNEENVGKKKHKPKLKVKGELLLEDLPPIQDLKITVPEDECIEFGKIHSIVDQLVLVNTLPNSILLDLETVIFLEKGQKVLGEVFDVLGQVADPLYCVRFNSNKQIKEKEIKVGDVVYIAPKTQYTQYVILSNLMKEKGSDASWENDIEPPPRFIDYSDDEQEKLARRQIRNKDRPTDNDDLSKRSRTIEGNGESSTSNKSQQPTYSRSRSGERRGGYRGDSDHYNSNSRQRNNRLHQNMQRPLNNHRGSWHSNYYRQPFSSQPPYIHNPQLNQPYVQHLPMYPMLPMYNMPYPLPAQYGGVPMAHRHTPQIIPNTFSTRPATLPEPPIYDPQ